MGKEREGWRRGIGKGRREGRKEREKGKGWEGKVGGKERGRGGGEEICQTNVKMLRTPLLYLEHNE